MPTKLLKNGKQQQTLLPATLLGPLFLPFLSLNNKLIQRPDDKLTALPQPFATQLGKSPGGVIKTRTEVC